ncbi:hypothetical protein GUJ93_ZPchr0013g36883 [Zizania palustris]|uniref:TCP domain-containing protein n=1 Tax=Zizania palustris TaxID=103762 RepID=A0A8J5WVP2_ZIZPA|nr:hypothetical protein GUJ93_ZPchr0013g36883 [Zizania palustris]
MDAAGDGARARDGDGGPGRSQGKRGRGSGGMRGSSGAEMEAALLAQTQGAGTASRIYRVKASGGKDRHSKVYTAKGIRDRRVRLSVSTAIQFYDLQDRLGYDQPSKAIEWLINAASPAIDKLPSLDLDPSAFASIPEQAEASAAGVRRRRQQQLSKSGCSSTSETSKGSELSLSRSDGRVAGSRDKEVTVASTPAQAASFTELLFSGVASAGVIGNAEQRQSWQLSTVSHVAADCVGIAHPGKGAEGVSTYGFSDQTTSSFGNAPPIGMVPAQPFNFPSSGDLTPYSLVHDELAAPPSPAGDYNLNFSMSSGFLGANRGTLQSNSPSHLSGNHQQLQRLDGPSISFLLGQAAAAVHPASESQLTVSAALQLWDGFRHSGMKEKNKN